MSLQDNLSGVNISIGDLPKLMDRFFGGDEDESYAEKLDSSNKELQKLSETLTNLVHINEKRNKNDE